MQTALESSHPPTMLRYHLANMLDLQIRRRQVVQCNVLLARFQWNKQGTFPSGLAVMLAQEDLLWGTWLSLQNTSCSWISTFVQSAGPFASMQTRRQSRLCLDVRNCL